MDVLVADTKVQIGDQQLGAGGQAMLGRMGGLIRRAAVQVVRPLVLRIATRRLAIRWLSRGRSQVTTLAYGAAAPRRAFCPPRPR